ncbi:MAG: EamA/RhaT family transporter [Erysipelotrichales bacterium]|nr:MAG: EamA/RhaT family transporter [Erysipelotrichales bacterium]
MKKNENNGPLWIVIGAVFWSFGGVCAKLIPWSGLAIASIRGIIAAVVIALYRRSFRFRLTKSTLFAAISLNLTTILFMMANKMTTAANAIVLQYTSPVFIIILSAIFLRERPKKRDLLAVVGTLFGVSLFFLDQMKSGNMLGNLIAILSGLAFACVFFANKLPGAHPMDATFLGSVLSFFLLPFVLADKQVFSTGWTPWVVILFMGVVQLGLGYIFFSIGIQHTSATTGNILATVEPILNPIWVFLVIGERPKFISLIGAAIVLTTIFIYNIILTRQNYQNKPT